MNDSTPRSLLERFRTLAAIDANLARLNIERKKIELDLKTSTAEAAKALQECGPAEKHLSERRLRYQKEERAIRDESERLKDRRKSLTSLGTYKLQQAAEREIEAAAHQLKAREDLLLNMLEELEAVEKKYNDLKTRSQELQKRATDLRAEAQDMVAANDARSQDELKARDSVVATLEKEPLSIYQRVRERYPSDPMVPLKSGNSCSACFMQLGPQVLVLFARGETLVKCAGCGRLVYPVPENN